MLYVENSIRKCCVSCISSFHKNHDTHDTHLLSGFCYGQKIERLFQAFVPIDFENQKTRH